MVDYDYVDHYEDSYENPGDIQSEEFIFKPFRRPVRPGSNIVGQWVIPKQDILISRDRESKRKTPFFSGVQYIVINAAMVRGYTRSDEAMLIEIANPILLNSLGWFPRSKFIIVKQRNV